MKCASEIAKGLFPDLEIPDTGWRAKWIKFRADYPKEKRNTHADRGAEAMKALNPDEALFTKMLAELAYQKASERWEDPAFIPHMASWINGKYWEHDPAQYRPRMLTKDDRCPECGDSWRVHRSFANRPGEQPNAAGMYCK